MITSIGYNYRHAPAVEHARTLIAAGSWAGSPMCGRRFSPVRQRAQGCVVVAVQPGVGGLRGVGRLFSHASDLCQYVVGPIAELTALTSTVYTERPKLAMGSGTHFDVIEGGEMGAVENEDYAAALVRFGVRRSGCRCGGHH